MKDITRKLTSRKLWAAVAGLIAGLAMVFGLDEGIMADVTGAVVAVASLITYIVTEGKVDAQAVAGAVVAVQDAVEAVKDEETLSVAVGDSSPRGGAAPHQSASLPASPEGEAISSRPPRRAEGAYGGTGSPVNCTPEAVSLSQERLQFTSPEGEAIRGRTEDSYAEQQGH